MRVRIQSKSGDLNHEFHTADGTLHQVFKTLRTVGGYYAERRGSKVYAPFEEIEYIEEINNEGMPVDAQ